MESCPKCNSELLVIEIDNESGQFVHCPECNIKWPRCEVYSRVVGYLRPVQQWNKGKQEEYKERKEYEIRI